jgi:hypothetical protein
MWRTCDQLGQEEQLMSTNTQRHLSFTYNLERRISNIKTGHRAKSTMVLWPHLPHWRPSL